MATVPASDAPSRRISLVGPLNFRDLGGYAGADGRTVRWRRVFRSDSLFRVTPEDAAHVVEELGLATIVDLRTAEEVAHFGRGALESSGLHYHQVPILDETQRTDPELIPKRPLEDLYLLMLDTAASQMARVLRLLATHDTHPVVFHCAVGKDRTGIVAAVLLKLLGVSDDDVVADYALTAEVMPTMIERFRAYADREGKERLREVPAHVFSAEPATMRAVLDALRHRYGSVDGYAAAIGLRPDEVEALRAALLGPVAGPALAQ